METKFSKSNFRNVVKEYYKMKFSNEMLKRHIIHRKEIFLKRTDFIENDSFHRKDTFIDSLLKT